MKIDLDRYERRYTGKRAGVAHLFGNVSGPAGMTLWIVSACGLGGDMWKGTGSQDEYERAAELPLCRNCLKQVGA